LRGKDRQLKALIDKTLYNKAFRRKAESLCNNATLIGKIMATLFEKLGGAAAVDLTVDKFYERVLQDDRFKHFFANMDMDKQRQHQKDFLTYPFGGTDQYNGRHI
jgi:hypothetical protein